ncbi:MAG: hypothetical protein GEU73_15425 [Chloroflexi bacterium]|nr:hypothetical protein [Chloroflexota bacterium]
MIGRVRRWCRRAVGRWFITAPSDQTSLSRERARVRYPQHAGPRSRCAAGGNAPRTWSQRVILRSKAEESVPASDGSFASLRMTEPFSAVPLERDREGIRLRHLSLSTAASYLLTIRRFLRFHGGRHPRAMGRSLSGLTRIPVARSARSTSPQ